VCGRLGDRRHILEPHPFEDGAFFFGSIPLRATDVWRVGVSGRGEVNSSGRTTLLWIKQVFGVCGEFVVSFPVALGFVAVCCGYLGRLRGGCRENATGKTWRNRGETMVKMWWEGGR
jgi:hypothetical protein